MLLVVRLYRLTVMTFRLSFLHYNNKILAKKKKKMGFKVIVKIYSKHAKGDVNQSIYYILLHRI